MKRIAMAMLFACTLALSAYAQSGTTNDLPATDSGNTIPTDNIMTEAPAVTELAPQPMAADGTVIEGGVVDGSSCGCQGTTTGTPVYYDSHHYSSGWSHGSGCCPTYGNGWGYGFRPIFGGLFSRGRYSSGCCGW